MKINVCDIKKQVEIAFIDIISAGLYNNIAPFSYMYMCVVFATKNNTKQTLDKISP